MKYTPRGIPYLEGTDRMDAVPEILRALADTVETLLVEGPQPPGVPIIEQVVTTDSDIRFRLLAPEKVVGAVARWWMLNEDFSTQPFIIAATLDSGRVWRYVETFPPTSCGTETVSVAVEDGTGRRGPWSLPVTVTYGKVPDPPVITGAPAGNTRATFTIAGKAVGWARVWRLRDTDRSGNVEITDYPNTGGTLTTGKLGLGAHTFEIAGVAPGSGVTDWSNTVGVTITPASEEGTPDGTHP